MRIGQNPAKGINEVAKPKRITVAVLNYIPFLSGFYADMLDVLKITLNSILENSDLPFDLLVFDNASCPEVREYLVEMQAQQKIQYLILSDTNIGKGGAWEIILGGAPGEIIAYTDNDCYFYPGWLSASVNILENFPNVGMVTSRPVALNHTFNTATIDWAENNDDVKIEKYKALDWETFKSFENSLGVPPEEIEKRYQEHEDIVLTYKGNNAFVGALHYQFLAYKKTMQEFIPFDMTKPMGQVRQLDIRLNEAGYLRLMTPEPYMNNMSNQVPDWIANSSVTKGPVKQKGFRFRDLKVIKWPLMRLYDWIFKIYWKDK